MSRVEIHELRRDVTALTNFIIKVRDEQSSGIASGARAITILSSQMHEMGNIIQTMFEEDNLTFAYLKEKISSGDYATEVEREELCQLLIIAAMREARNAADVKRLNSDDTSYQLAVTINNIIKFLDNAVVVVPVNVTIPVNDKMWVNGSSQTLARMLSGDVGSSEVALTTTRPYNCEYVNPRLRWIPYAGPYTYNRFQAYSSPLDENSYNVMLLEYKYFYAPPTSITDGKFTVSNITWSNAIIPLGGLAIDPANYNFIEDVCNVQIDNIEFLNVEPVERYNKIANTTTTGVYLNFKVKLIKVAGESFTDILFNSMNYIPLNMGFDLSYDTISGATVPLIDLTTIPKTSELGRNLEVLRHQLEYLENNISHLAGAIDDIKDGLKGPPWWKTAANLAAFGLMFLPPIGTAIGALVTIGMGVEQMVEDGKPSIASVGNIGIGLAMAVMHKKAKAEKEGVDMHGVDMAELEIALKRYRNTVNEVESKALEDPGTHPPLRKVRIGLDNDTFLADHISENEVIQKGVRKGVKALNSTAAKLGRFYPKNLKHMPTHGFMHVSEGALPTGGLITEYGEVSLGRLLKMDAVDKYLANHQTGGMPGTIDEYIRTDSWAQRTWAKLPDEAKVELNSLWTTDFDLFTSKFSETMTFHEHFADGVGVELISTRTQDFSTWESEIGNNGRPKGESTTWIDIGHTDASDAEIKFYTDLSAARGEYALLKNSCQFHVQDMRKIFVYNTLPAWMKEIPLSFIQDMDSYSSLSVSEKLRFSDRRDFSSSKYVRDTLNI